MLGSDPGIPFRSALSARLFQALFPLQFRLQLSSPDVQFATKPIAKPTTLTIPTRHGDINAPLYEPTDADIAAALAAGRRPPIHFITHAGGFIIRRANRKTTSPATSPPSSAPTSFCPTSTPPPTVRHPITEHEAYDAFVRVHEHGDDYGWDGDRLSIGGPSSGSQAAFSVVAQAIDAGGYRPIAVSSEFGVAEISRPDDTRTSSRKRPAVSQRLMRLVKSTYFAGADLTDPLVSPAHSPRLGEFPPTLILTAELDTLRDEMTDSEGSHMSDSTPTASTTTSSASSRTPRSAA